MKTLMIDMDDVMVYGRFFDLVKKFTGKNIALEDVKTYYLQDLIEQDVEKFWEEIQDENFYENSELIEDCYEVIKELNDHYDIYIVTAYIWRHHIDISGKNLNNKYNFLREKLPFIDSKKYIFTTNKNILKFDIKIDDRPSNLEGASRKILFTAWHNKNLLDEELAKDNIIRANTWNDIKSILLEGENL